jgi:hypothetical protein
VNTRETIAMNARDFDENEKHSHARIESSRRDSRWIARAFARARAVAPRPWPIELSFARSRPIATTSTRVVVAR